MSETYQIYWKDRITNQSGFLADHYSTYRTALEFVDRLHVDHPNWVMMIARVSEDYGGRSVEAVTLIQAGETT